MSGWSADGLAHEAMLFDGPHHVAARCIPFVEEALDEHQPVMVSASYEVLAVLRDTFGAVTDSFELFAPASEWWRGTPHATWMAARRAVQRLRRRGEPWRLVGEPVWATDDPHRKWCRLEAALQHGPDDAPCYHLCLHAASDLDETAAGDVAASHPLWWDREQNVTARLDVDPVTFIRGIEPPVVEPPAGAPTAAVATSADARRTAAPVVIGALGDQRGADLLVALSELTENALAAGGEVTLSWWQESDDLVWQVADDGPGFDASLAGYVAPDPEALGGRGLWIARALSDDMAIRSTPDGTTAQVRMSLMAPG